MRRSTRTGFRRGQMFRPYIGHGYPCVQEKCFPALTTEFPACSVLTQPEPLPTHYYRPLSLTVDFDDELELKDPATARDRMQLRDAILRMITPYVESAG